MTNSIRVSIVTVVLNDMQGLKRTAESVAGQSYSNLEWVVKDGGSTEDHVAPAEAIVEGVVDFFGISGPDKGIYDAMNIGVTRSTGKFVVFVNAGDTFTDSRSVEKVVNEIVESGESDAAEILYGGANLVFENGDSVYRAPREAKKAIWHGLPANHQATYFRRSRLLNVPYDLLYRVCGDYYLVAMLERAGIRSVYLDESIIDFMIGGFSFTNPLQLHIEPAMIQRRVLNNSIFLVAASMFRRFVATAILALLVIIRKKGSAGQ